MLSTHEALIVEKCRDVCISGKATLTIVASRPIINWQAKMMPRMTPGDFGALYGGYGTRSGFGGGQ